MATAEILGSLLLGGLMGLVGQGARAIVGLKKLNDENLAQGPNQTDTFIASRLLVSLFIGFVAGVIAVITLRSDALATLAPFGMDLLLGLAAAGYAGTDIIEGFVARLAPKPAEPPKDNAAEPQPEAPSQAVTKAAVTEALAASVSFNAMKSQLGGIEAEMASLKSLLGGAKVAEPLASDPLDAITPELVHKLFVAATPLNNIKTHLPSVLAGLQEKELTDRDMLIMALATIRAETEGFAPISEGKSKYNTKTTPFDLYDAGTQKGEDLGNTEAGDGPLFRGRGFVQLTGRYNYAEVGEQIDVDLVATPQLANDSIIAGRILAQFLANKQAVIREALAQGDLAKARRAVNGGTHGMTRFTDAWNKGQKHIPAFA